MRGIKYSFSILNLCYLTAGEGGLTYKSDGGDHWNLKKKKKKKPLKVPEFCFVDVVWTIFILNLEVPNQLTDIYFLSYFSAQYPKRYHHNSDGNHLRF